MKKNLAVVLLVFVCVLTAGYVVGLNAKKASDGVYLTLVNKTHKLPEDWLSKIRLTAVGNNVDVSEIFLIEKETLGHYYGLCDELYSEGIDIELDSVYRSVEEQVELWDYFKEEYGEDYCKQYVAVPGYSEHHTGLAVDVFLVKDGEIIRENDDMIAEREIFAKVHEKLAKYGFILRYPEGKEDITGYAYEPWHFRYVGEGPAQEIMGRGITLEEYLGE